MVTDIFGLWGFANGYGKHLANLTQYQATAAFKVSPSIPGKYVVKFTSLTCFAVVLLKSNHIQDIAEPHQDVNSPALSTPLQPYQAV